MAPLMLFSAMPTAQSISSDARIQLAAGGDSTFNRDVYPEGAGTPCTDGSKSCTTSARSKAKGQEEGNAAENEVNATWTKANAEQHKLQSASAEGWVSAKISFEKAAHDLNEAWDRIGPDDK